MKASERQDCGIAQTNGVTYETREKQLTTCAVKDEAVNSCTAETWNWIEQNEPCLVQNGNKTTLMVMRKSIEGVFV